MRPLPGAVLSHGVGALVRKGTSAEVTLVSEIEPFYPLPTAQVQAHVDALGMEATIDFLLAFGGSELSLSTDPKGRGMVEAVVGYPKAKALADAAHLPQRRVPLANSWLARCLYAQGLSTLAIARRLRITDVTVRAYLSGRNTPRPAPVKRDRP